MAVNNADDIVDVLLDHLVVLMRAHDRAVSGESWTRSPATTPSAVVT